jgi:hypothetical protein
VEILRIQVGGVAAQHEIPMEILPRAATGISTNVVRSGAI